MLLHEYVLMWVAWPVNPVKTLLSFKDSLYGTIPSFHHGKSEEIIGCGRKREERASLDERQGRNCRVVVVLPSGSGWMTIRTICTCGSFQASKRMVNLTDFT